jgi:S1-C subfamily serine protease
VIGTLKQLGLVVFLGVFAFLGGAAAVFLAPRVIGPAWAQTLSPTSRGDSDLVRISERFEAVARKVGPAVVAVDATKPTAKIGKAKAIEESGSGVLIRAEGQRGVLVVTNNHVISGAGPSQITVSLADDRVVRPTRVWTDPESDVAVLAIEGGDGMATAVLGDSDRVRVGQWVVAIGSPFGLNQTVTHGIISARERGQVGLGNTIRIKDFLQTDAAINPGSSGGPLVNLDGEVIGLNTAIASHSGVSSGVAFSIPINLVKGVVRQLLEKGIVSRGYLGMQLAESFDPAMALRLGLERAQGALVEAVYPDTPAAAVGVRVNDVVVEVDGIVVRNENHMINLITRMSPGQKIRLRVWRDRKTLSMEAVVGDWSKEQGRFRAGPGQP